MVPLTHDMQLSCTSLALFLIMLELSNFALHLASMSYIVNTAAQLLYNFMDQLILLDESHERWYHASYYDAQFYFPFLMTQCLKRICHCKCPNQLHLLQKYPKHQHA